MVKSAPFSRFSREGATKNSFSLRDPRQCGGVSSPMARKIGSTFESSETMASSQYTDFGGDRRSFKFSQVSPPSRLRNSPWPLLPSYGGLSAPVVRNTRSGSERDRSTLCWSWQTPVSTSQVWPPSWLRMRSPTSIAANRRRLSSGETAIQRTWAGPRGLLQTAAAGWPRTPSSSRQVRPPSSLAKIAAGLVPTYRRSGSAGSMAADTMRSRGRPSPTSVQCAPPSTLRKTPPGK